MSPEDIERILDYILKTLSPAGEHLLDLAIRQSLSYAVLDLLFGLLLILTGFLFVHFVRRAHRAIAEKNERSGYSDTVDLEMARGLSVILAVLAFLFAVPVIGSGIWRLLNPELSAIQDLINIIKP